MTQDASQSEPKDWYTIAGNYAPLAIVAILALGGTGAAATGNLKLSGNTPRITGPDDPIAVAIGHAEGTRTCDGGKTRAYGSHKDPGDRKSNRGTFSAAPRGNGISAGMTPEEADISYIGNLNRHMDKDQFTGDRLAVVNYYDLGVQAPATLGDYVKNIKAGQPIVQARVNAFKRSDGSVDAAGFGHSLTRLTADQQRRFDRISQCLNGDKS
jgi:hypothetical protein